jgi:hypothetical protein
MQINENMVGMISLHRGYQCVNEKLANEIFHAKGFRLARVRARPRKGGPRVGP